MLDIRNGIAKGIENVDFFLLVQEGPISIVINN